MANSSDSVNVLFGADVSGLSAGLSQASSAISGALNGIKSGFQGVANDVQAATSSMASSFAGVGTSVSALATPLTAIIGLVSGGIFAEAIEKTNQMISSSRNLSIELGLSTDKVAGLKEALAEIGVSTDTYSDAYLKFARQIKSNEETLNKLGLTTRDNNGQLLNGNVLFQNALNLVTQYKSGIDQTEVALTLFGRSVKDVYDLLRLHADAEAEATARAKELGNVVTNENIAAYDDWRKATADLDAVGSAFFKSISDNFLPVLTDFVKVITNIAEAILPEFRLEMQRLAEVFAVVELACTAIVAPIIAAFKAIGDAAIATADAIKAAFSGSLTDAAAAVKTGLSNIKNEFATSDAQILSAWQNTVKVYNQTTGTIATPASGTKTFNPPKAKGGGGAAKKANKEELQMAEELANEEKTLDLQSLDDKKTIAQAEVQLGLITKQQELQMEQQFEDQKYQIEQQALERKLAAEQADPDSNPVAKQKILDQLLTLQAQHESAILKLKLQTYEESQKLNQQATTAIQGDFETLFTSVISGQKTLAQAFNDFVSSVTQAISKLAAQYLEAAIFGGGTGGGGIGSFIGSIFGGGGGISSIIGGGGSGLLSGGGLAGVAAFGGALAGGGDVTPGMYYTVGENGPETFVPTSPGTIVPNGSTVGSNQTVSVVNNFSVQGQMNQANQQQIATQVGLSIQSAMKRNA